ncbi:MAG: hypothetical protein OXU20_29925, partial [Myxococcales bacterium]|nr:hypothetical protein [Myxococcales bacterium]MDD9967925.1 hypothetical protein [Myxococcales bacterium]
MRLKNNYTSDIYWRIFHWNDTVCAVGLKDGTLEPGQEMTWIDNSFSQYKIEIKKHSFFKEFLIRAGRRYSMDQDLVVNGSGRLTIA